MCFGVGLAQGLDELLSALRRRLASFVLGAGQEVPTSVADELFHGDPHLVGEGRRLYLRLLLAYPGGHLFLKVDELSVGVLTDAQGLQHQRLMHLARAGLHHDHRVAGAGYHQVQLAVGELGEGGVDHELTVHVADAGAGDGAVEGDVGQGEGGGGSRDHQDVGVVLLVGGEDGADDLGLVAHALGEEGPQGPIGEAAGEYGLAGGPALAPEEAAGDLARRVQPLLVIYRQREEVRPLAGIAHAGGDQHHGIAVADDHRPVRLAGHTAYLHTQFSAAYSAAKSLSHYSLKTSRHPRVTRTSSSMR